MIFGQPSFETLPADMASPKMIMKLVLQSVFAYDIDIDPKAVA